MNLLAFDTSTEHLSIAVQRGERQWVHDGAGGAQASTTLIASVLALLAEAGLTLRDLRAIAFGRGPGSFTGLRAACSVAQGLALGADLPVLAIDTLLAVAEDVRHRHGDTHVLALQDARMDQVYAAPWCWSAAEGWVASGETVVCAPEALCLPPDAEGCWALGGNAMAVYGARLPRSLGALPSRAARPEAAALLRLAPAWLAAGRAVAADQALPLYIRDKVAQTTAERAAVAR